MRVGVDLRCLTEPAGSGVATYTRAVLSALAESPYAQSVAWQGFTTGWPMSSALNLPLAMPVKQWPWPNRLTNMMVAFLSWPSATRLVGAVDCVWQPNPLFFPASSIPQVVTIHDLSFLHYPQFFALRTRLWYLRWVRYWLEHPPRLAHLVCVSQATAEDVIERYPHWRSRMTIVAPPPPADQPLRSDPESFNRLGIAGPYVLCVGTLELRKNIEGVAAGFSQFARRHPAYELVFVGQWGRGERFLRRVLAHASNVSRIHVLGYVSTMQREALYQRAFAVVYPSFYEGYGYPPLEAMAYGVPVVVSSVTSLPEVLDQAALYIDPDHVAYELPAVLTALVEDPTLYREYQARSRVHLEKLRHCFSINPLLEVWQRYALA